MAEDEVPSELPNLSGKVLTVYLKSAPRQFDAGVLIEFPELKLLGGRLFLVGRAPGLEWDEQWVSRLPVVVAWDSITHYLTFDSREDYQSRMKLTEQPLWRRVLAAFRSA